MHSGSNNGHAGFISREEKEKQDVFLSAILQKYAVKGYVVREMPQAERQMLSLEEDVLHDVLCAQQPVSELKRGSEYVVLPENFGAANGDEGHNNGMDVQYKGIWFSAYTFAVNTEHIVVQGFKFEKLEHLAFSEFYSALEMLKPAIRVANRRMSRR